MPTQFLCCPRFTVIIGNFIFILLDLQRVCDKVAPVRLADERLGGKDAESFFSWKYMWLLFNLPETSPSYLFHRMKTNLSLDIRCVISAEHFLNDAHMNNTAVYLLVEHILFFELIE